MPDPGPRTPGAPEISLLVVNYNTRDLLLRCLESMESHPPSRPWELIVVDDHSTDGSPERVRERFPRARLIVQPRNLGYACANNAGLRAARGRYVVLLNSDLEMRGATFDVLAGFLDATPRAGAAGTTLVNPDGTPQLSCRLLPDLPVTLLHSLGVHKIWKGCPSIRHYYQVDRDYACLDEVEMASLACCMFRREVVETVGLLDERYFLYVGDTDWVFRIRKAGWLIYYVPGPPVVHYGGESARLGGLFLILDFHRGMFRYYHKHLQDRYPSWIYPLVALGVGMRMLLYAARNLLGFSNRVCASDYKRVNS